MRIEEAAAGYARVPARVLLRGEPDGWHCVVVDGAGAERRTDLAGAGTRWSSARASGPEPPWWGRRLAETAERLRELVAERLTDAVFGEFGAEAAITWFAVDEPVEWEGLVTLQEPDPARFPGRVAPYVITLEPGRGALLPDVSLLFSTRASDAWTALAGVAEHCRTAPPQASFLCGWADHRSVRIGRGRLALSTERGEDGVERIAEIVGTRRPGWSGNPELRLRLDGVDLLDEPAADVAALLRGLGHEIVRPSGGHGGTLRVPAIGLSLYGPDPRDRAEPAGPGPAGPDRFAAASFQLPSALAALRTIT
ncbi:hypothetical protein [Actinomadura roseirufa]|uniref:hypothetical protein n=1 Tax=Actinomadura roseirufa TaxID=2094049 RepID=UPI001040FF2F|nr:hypothetical protein [Actinomadura roseirufa]